MEPQPPHPRRPAFLVPAAMDSLQGGGDPADREEAAQTTARLLVQGVRDSQDAAVLDRLVGLADEHGLELVAELWSDSPADSLPGALWRLYALRAWVHRDPAGAAAEFDEGRRRTPVLEVVAGVADPPGPDQVREMVDAVLTGLGRGDLGVTLERAAAFARICSVGRAHGAGPAGSVDGGSDTTAVTISAARLVRTAEQLETAAGRWRIGELI